MKADLSSNKHTHSKLERFSRLISIISIEDTSSGEALPPSDLNSYPHIGQSLATVFVLAGWGEIINVEGYVFKGLEKDYKCVFLVK